MDNLLKSYHPHVSNNTKGDKFLYRTASPAKMIKDEKYPLLVFFHGAGGRGDNNMGQLLDAGGLQAFEKAGEEQNFNPMFLQVRSQRVKGGLMCIGLFLDIKCLRFRVPCAWPSRL